MAAVIDQLVHHLIELGGSDLHIAEGQPPKVRVHGGVRPISEEILTRDVMETMLTGICDARAWEKFIARGDLDFAYEMDEDSRFRCNYYKQQNGYGAVFRLIPTKIKTLEQLGKLFQLFGRQFSCHCCKHRD